LTPAPDGALDMEVMVEAPGRRFDMLFVRIPVGGATADEPRAHDAYEALFVIRGRAALEIGSVREELGSGDTVYYSGRTPHRVVNIGRGELVLIDVVAGRF